MEEVSGDLLLDGGIIRHIYPGGAKASDLEELVPSTFVDAEGKWVSPG